MLDVKRVNRIVAIIMAIIIAFSNWGYTATISNLRAVRAEERAAIYTEEEESLGLWKPEKGVRNKLRRLIKQGNESAVRVGEKIGVAEPFIRCLEEGKDVRIKATKALGIIGDPIAVDPLIGRLKDEDKDVRLEAIRALGRIGDSRAVDPLIECLENKYGWVQKRLADTLGNIGGEKALDEMADNLELKYCSQLGDIVRFFGGLGVVLPLEVLIEGLENKYYWNLTRAEAANALGKIGDRKAAKPLIGCLKDKNAYVRRKVAEALGMIGDSIAVGPLVGRLKDRDKDVRRVTAQALDKMDESRAVKPAIIDLQDEDKDVRIIAAPTLSKKGDPRAVESLIECLEDENKDVRRGAVEALVKIGDLRAVEQLRKYEYFQKAELAISNFCSQNSTYDIGTLRTLHSNKEKLFSHLKLAQEQAKQLLHDIVYIDGKTRHLYGLKIEKGQLLFSQDEITFLEEDIATNGYGCTKERLSNLVANLKKTLVHPEFLGPGQIGRALYTKITKLAEWFSQPLLYNSEIRDAARLFGDMPFEHNQIYTFYNKYSIRVNPVRRRDLAVGLVEGTHSSHSSVGRALCWWLYDTELARRGNYFIRQKALDGIAKLEWLNEEDKNRLLRAAITDTSQYVREQAREIIYEKADFIDAYLLRRLYEVESTTRKFLQEEQGSFNAGSRLALNRWANNIRRFRGRMSEDVERFSNEVYLPFGSESKFGYSGKTRNEAIAEADKLRRHTTYCASCPISSHPTLSIFSQFAPSLDPLLQERLRLVNLRWDIADKRLPTYFGRAITKTINENIATPEQNPFIKQYNATATVDERRELIGAIVLDVEDENIEEERYNALNFLTYIIINWHYEKKNLSEEGLFNACAKVRELSDDASPDTILLSIVSHAKETEDNLSGVAARGINRYYDLRLNKPMEILEREIERMRLLIKHPPSDETDLVKVEPAPLIGPESEEPGAIEKVTEAAKKIGKRMFGEREDIEDRPIEYKITPEALRLRLDIRSSMDKEESLRLLRDKRKDLAELHQKITDRKKQDRILEALNAIGKLIEEERQRSSSPKKKYIPNMYPLVPYVDNNLSHLKRNHMMLQNNI